jgi:periplasmic copper chaperone A
MMFKPKFARPVVSGAAALALLLVTALPVAAHASVPDGTEVPSNGSAVVHVRIPHGCGDAAVTAVEVKLPDGVVSAKPELIAGWESSVTKVAASYSLWGTEYTERVGTITWAGGPLPDGQYLDFGINATFQLEAGEYALPVIQYCGKESVAWIEIPTEGQSHDDLEYPAPMFTVVDAVADGHGTSDNHSVSTDDMTNDSVTESATTTDPMVYVALLLGASALALSLLRGRTSGATRR